MHVLSLEWINHIFELPIECNIQWLNEYNFCLALTFHFVNNCWGLLRLVYIRDEEL